MDNRIAEGKDGEVVNESQLNEDTQEEEDGYPDTYKKRKKTKFDIKFRVTLNAEQKDVKTSIMKDTISVITGRAGSGKTLLATRIALEGMFMREFERIVITRPTVSNEDIGFLPGDIKEKMDPWLAPIYQNMYACYDKQKIDKHIADNTIEIAPISFLRGRTFCNSCVIVDEAQNVTKEQMEMILTRLGTDSKMIISGDIGQSDLKRKGDSGFHLIYHLRDKVKGFNIYELKTNMRHPIVDAILEELSNK